MIGLIPLDERPVNVRYPQMIAAIAGVDLRQPPAELLSAERRPASSELIEWLLDQGRQIDALIVSCEMLGYGGLMASRITDDPVQDVLSRLDALRQLRQMRPSLPILGFNLITRVSNANHNVEEPLYWGTYGERLYRFSQLHDRASQGQPVMADVKKLRSEIPKAHVGDFLRRRARNHTVNMAVLHFLSEGIFDLLVLSSDDTSAYGLGSREKRWLQEWVDLLDLEDRLLMYPGADEVGCVLLARLINEQRGFVPTFQSVYAQAERAELVAPYEDGPIRVTIERQVRAVNGRLGEDEGDILLAVNPPDPSCFEFDAPAAAAAYAERSAALKDFVTGIVKSAVPIALVDVAYPNGSDPYLIDLLFKQPAAATQLAAYGGWNTAGNTVGTALAQACAADGLAGETRQVAQARLLLHRFIEDWGYQRVVRQRTRDWLYERAAVREISEETLPMAAAYVEEQLQGLLPQIPNAAGWSIVPGSVRFPWRRLFEVDFELQNHPSTSPIGRAAACCGRSIFPDRVVGG